MTDEIVWKDPPEANRSDKRGAWAERLTPLMAYPNRWAVVYVSSSSNVNRGPQ